MRGLLLLCAAVAGCSGITVVSEQPSDRGIVARAHPVAIATLQVEPFSPLEPADLAALQRSYRTRLWSASRRSELIAREEGAGVGVLVQAVLREVPRQRRFSQAMELIPTVELSVFGPTKRRVLLYTATLELERGAPDDGARGLSAAAEGLADWLAELLGPDPR